MSFWSAGRELARDRSGATAIEFSFLAIPFFLMMFAIMETSLVFLGELTLDNGVESVARQVRVGTITTKNEAEFRSALCIRVSYLMDCSKLKIDVRSYKKFSDITDANIVVAGDIANGSLTYAPGGTNSITTVRVYYKWPIVTDVMRIYLSDMKDGSHLLASTTAFQSETF